MLVRVLRYALPLAIVSSFGLACADDAREPGSAPDSGFADSGVQADSGVSVDAAPSDAASVDGALTDAGSSDAAPADSGSVDAGQLPTGHEEVPVAGGAFNIVRDGLFGGVVLSLHRSPADTSIVYAGTDGAGLFRSDDGGETWRPTALDRLSITAMALHPTDAQRLWVIRAGARTGSITSSGRTVAVFASDDGGSTFTQVSLPADMSQARHVALSQGAIWIAGYVPSGTSVFRSMDGGLTWVSTAFPSASVFNLVAHPSDPDIAWTRDQQVVLRTGDGGASFADVTPTLENGDFPYSLAVSPVAPLRLWLGVANGTPFRSDDGGQTWQRLDSAGGRSHFLYPSPINADTVWAVDSRDGVLISDNAGTSFRRANLSRDRFNRVAPRISPLNSVEALIYGTAFEIRRTKDGGNSWTRTTEGLSAVWVRDVAISADGARLVAVDDHGAVFVSEDQGRTFERSVAGLPPLALTAVALDPSNPDIVYVGTGTGHGSALHRTNFVGSLYKSIDGARTFSQITTPRGRDYVLEIGAITVSHDGAVLVREGEAFPARSTDGGITWTALAPTERAVFTDRRAAPVGGGSLLTGITTGTRSYLAVSSDLGSSWASVPGGSSDLGLDRVELAISSRADPLVHFAYTSMAFARYSGSAWGRAEVGLASVPGRLPDLFAIAVGAANGVDRIVAIGRTSTEAEPQWSLHISADGALSWGTQTIPYLGLPSVARAAEGTGDLFAIGLEGGRGLLVTRTGGL